MNRLNNNFFRHLAQKLPGFKQQFGEAAKARKLTQNGVLQDGVPCGVCGKKFSIKTTIILKTEKPIKYCSECETALNDGDAAFVTVEKKPRYWIGKGTHPKFAGHVTVITTEQMDAIERLKKKQKPPPNHDANEPNGDDSRSREASGGT